jgi:hypothetical protein
MQMLGHALRHEPMRHGPTSPLQVCQLPIPRIQWHRVLAIVSVLIGALGEDIECKQTLYPV